MKFYSKSTGATINSFVIDGVTDSGFTADTSNVDISSIYQTFEVGADVAATSISIGEEYAITNYDDENENYSSCAV